MFTREYITDIIGRAARTWAQTALSVITIAGVTTMEGVSWGLVVSTASLAAILSILGALSYPPTAIDTTPKRAEIE